MTAYIPEVLSGLKLTQEAGRACSLAYNEKFVGVHKNNPDEIVAIFHANRGSEVSQGIRAVVLARVMTSATDEVWTLGLDLFNRHVGLTTTSRRGSNHAPMVDAPDAHRDLNSHSGSLL